MHETCTLPPERKANQAASIKKLSVSCEDLLPATLQELYPWPSKNWTGWVEGPRGNGLMNPLLLLQHMQCVVFCGQREEQLPSTEAQLPPTSLDMFAIFGPGMTSTPCRGGQPSSIDWDPSRGPISPCASVEC